jgi:hypothetical protein
MSEDPPVERQLQRPTDDPDATTVRPALADDLLDPAPRPDDDDAFADEEFLTPGGRRPSRLTRILLALLICAVGVFIGVQVGKVAGGSGSRAAGPSRSGTAAPRAAGGSSAPAAQGEVTSVKAHTLVLADQGTNRMVTFTDDTAVTKPYAHGALGVGDAVTVFGSRAADGSVNATSIVVR